MKDGSIDRRRFMKKAVIGGCGLVWGAYTLGELLGEGPAGGLRVGFRNDAPEELWKWSREADWYEQEGRLVRCVLCPHECILGEDDRGFCRTRVVKGGKLYTVAYGNPCAVHIDPIEKKPLYHFLPGTPVFSLATAGCNLRCFNCQNWEISQSKPEQTENFDLLPEQLVQVTAEKRVSSIAYTYSEPIVFFEYVRDAAAKARELGIRNVLVTAGYISEKPLRQLCRSIDAVTLDLKGFNERLYRKVTGSRLQPILRCLEVIREEGVWLEVSRLIVPAHSDDLDDIRALCRWVAGELGAGTPLHFLRFHPAYKLEGLPPTPVDLMDRARDIAREAGLHYVFVGNVPGHSAQDTVCPNCGRRVIERNGFQVKNNLLDGGCCPCGEEIPGVWA
jgi:pyruvate formate lyase activating enzyme